MWACLVINLRLALWYSVIFFVNSSIRIARSWRKVYESIIRLKYIRYTCPYRHVRLESAVVSSHRGGLTLYLYVILVLYTNFFLLFLIPKRVFYDRRASFHKSVCNARTIVMSCMMVLYGFQFLTDDYCSSRSHILYIIVTYIAYRIITDWNPIL